MFLQQLDLTDGLRPYLSPGESLIFVQDGVGLYEGKYKIPHYQNGKVYLTSHRVCYVDNSEPRRYAVALHLKDVDKYEFYAGFLKSSAKVTLYRIKPTRPIVGAQSPKGTITPDSPNRGPAPSPAPRINANWICPICSFSNPIPPDFDPATANSRTPLEKCQLCGTPPEFIHVVKAAIAAGRQPLSVNTSEDSPSEPQSKSPEDESESKIRCPRCTFDNDPYLLECEQCGTSLAPLRNPRLDFTRNHGRTPSPGPTMSDISLNDDSVNSVKVSFRIGGEKPFFDRLKGAMVQRKWLLQGAPPVPQENELGSPGNKPNDNSNRLVGIAGLEMRGQDIRRKNERLIGTSFEDLDALMASAKEVVALAETFSAQSKASNALDPEVQALVEMSASALGLATTKDLLGSDDLYIPELSRNLAEFLMDDSKGVLRKSGGVMTLVDVWAIFNRIRNGVELVSPADFKQAAEMWEKLKLPIRLRQFKSGLLVVQGTDRTEEKVVAGILAWLKDLRNQPLPNGAAWDWQLYGRGVTIHEAAIKFGWSIGIATEELEMAEERGFLCREQALGGILFWENHLIPDK